jgi:2-polyprenyl-3-methyl-5-hydroxy-6-metoxy-1,4-benzoquinol methylase
MGGEFNATGFLSTRRSSKESYYLGSRDDLIRLIPAGTRKILEIGCAAGMTGRTLKRLGFEEVVGVELVEDAARKAQAFYDLVITGDVEKMQLPYEKGHFDCILYGDVLEHLIDPWRLLRQHNLLLCPGGAIICSVPNVRHYRHMKKLFLRGEWEYRERGILDRTHLRFFTVKSIRAMVEDAGFEITTMIKRPSGVTWLKWLNRALHNRLIDHLVVQYVFVAVKKRETSEE